MLFRSNLFALPDLAAPDRLQVMTIHKAKGLEFDAVIVPGLAAGTGRDERKLFLWMETAAESLLLAPINPTGSSEDPIYEYIRGLDKQKADHENARLLYVAATRARHRLHLLGEVKLDDHGDAQQPARGSLLAKLWPALGGEFRVEEGRPVAPTSGTVPPGLQGALRRLAIDRFAYDVPAAVAWTPPPEGRGPEIEFSWVGDTARRVGSVVHRWLQRIAESEAREWSRARLEAARAAIENELAAGGVAEGEVGVACERTISALANALEDPRGTWLLGPQRDARNEYRLSAVVDGVQRDFVIDRMFRDSEGRTWIVDYKTSSHEGAGVERFLAEEEKRYRPQLDGYAAALQTPSAKRGLYFPLLKAWREW